MRFQKIKKTGELVINYTKGFAESIDRYNTLKKLVDGWRDITIAIDTNQRILNNSTDIIEDYLSKEGITHKNVPISANKTVYLGFNIRLPQDKNRKEKLIIIDISFEQFNEKFYDLIKNYDLAIGLGRKRPFDESCEALIINLSETLFSKYYFEGSIYDSVVCTSLRCSSNMKNIEAMINEMDL